MGIAKVKEHLKKYGLADDVAELPIVSGTVDEAAKAIGIEPKLVAKTLAFYNEKEGGLSTIIVVVAGDTKIFAGNFKRHFGFKPRMLSIEDVNKATGHIVGGVCPFGLSNTAKVYLDVSLKRFESVYPACGTTNSYIKITLKNLELASEFVEYVDVCHNET
jgi:prolyl-tRNA editing enzyme YbaK/EbsC (Cys-tRNA(Pro) deacylase)